MLKKKPADITTLLQWLILLSAILLPFIVIRFFPKFHHSYDLRLFLEWSEPWQEDWRSVYMNCDTCTYPFIGTFLSSGVMSAFDYKNVARVINRFRYYLAVVDGLNVIVFWFILTRLHVKRAPLWAGVIGLLPTSWIGSSVWGQIDGIGQFLILLFFVLMIWFNSMPRTNTAYYFFLTTAGTLLSLMLLTKQLIYFSMGALGLVLLVIIFWRSQEPLHVILSILTVGAAFLFPVILVDANLKLDAPYFSHLQFLVSARSQQWDIISSLGFNIWVFFFKDLLGSARTPLFFGALSPNLLGIILFLALNIFLFLIFVRDIKRQTRAGPHGFERGQIISCLIYFSLVNLTFNLTLTGTHERYLYHFYPFILMACLGLFHHSRFFNRTLLTSLLAGSLFYGGYLYLYLSGRIDTADRGFIQVAAVVHLGLYIYLLYSWIRNSTSQSPDLTPA